MEHVKALIIKFIMVTAVLFVILSLIYGVDFGDVLLISVVLTAVSYLGDVYVLPNTSNTVATLGDLGLAFVIVWLFGGSVIEEALPIVTASIISAIVISVGELLFHMYMEKNVLDGEHEGNTGVSDHDFNTEFGSDDTDEKKAYDETSKKDDNQE